MTAVSAPERPATRSRRASSLAWVGWLRFLAIGGVIGVHLSGDTAILPTALDTRYGTVAIAVNAASRFCVPLFVMLSGALLLDPDRYPGDRAFLRKRALRLVPAVVFWHAFYYAHRVLVLGWEMPTPRAIVSEVVNGKTFTALYFFWIVLGLMVVTPVLVAWIRTASRTAVTLAAAVALSIPVLTMALRSFLLTEGVVFVQTPWTWWIPYLGMYLLGYALRDVVARGPWLAGLAVAVLGLAALQPYVWKGSDVPGWLSAIAPLSYYGLGVILYTAGIFVLGRSLIRPEGLLRSLARGRPARIGRVLGDATLGVFVLHLFVLWAVLESGVLGVEEWVTSTLYLGLRLTAVLALTYTLVLLLRQVPVVKRLV